MTFPFTLTIQNGLAIYTLGAGPPLLLFPYPHAATLRPMAEDLLPQQFAGLGYRVITFDPPGAYRSNRPMHGDMAEMLACAVEALQVCQVASPLPVAGHSMGGLCALGLAIERPELVQRLALIGACSGFPAVMRWSTPHNWRPWRDGDWWRVFWYGFRQMTGAGSLANYKRLNNLVEKAAFVDPQYIELWMIEPGDEQRPAPPRAIWLQSVRSIDYRRRLSAVRAPTWLAVGRADPETPLPCSKELQRGIPDARLVVFECSGHAPFIEEPQRFIQELEGFLT